MLYWSELRTTRAVWVFIWILVIFGRLAAAQAPGQRTGVFESSERVGASNDGRATEAGGVYNLESARSRFAGTADTFLFVSKTIEGDGQIIVKVNSVSADGTAGAMFRDSLAPDAAYAAALVTPAGVMFQRRADPGTTATASLIRGVRPPVWLRLIRANGQFVACFATQEPRPETPQWRIIGTGQTVSMGAKAKVGLVGASPAETLALCAAMASVEVTTGAPSGLPAVTVPDASPATPGPGMVYLSSYFNRDGIVSEGKKPVRGLDDKEHYALVADLLGREVVWGKVHFTIGPVSGMNVVSCRGQSIPLPAGQYRAIRMLATGANGTQENQPFTVRYSDGTSSVTKLTIPDWWDSVSRHTDQKVVKAMTFRVTPSGDKQGGDAVLYGHTIPLGSGKAAVSLVLPNQPNVVVLAITLE